MTATAVVLRTLLVIASLTSPSPLGISFSRAAEVIASKDSYIDGVIAEITQCRRKEGVLTIEMKLHNTTTEAVSFYIDLDYDKFYVTARNKKYSVLRDTQGHPIARQSSGNITIKQDSRWTLWAKYPAPPPDVKNITYVTSLTVPFDDLPVTD